ncbi:hypothetical protein [Novosphingobium colocasiae]|uniref:hypothetical protein n=1 Tax=Novosphingobium colocasiae TaxID=1256513 RepID=UPI0035B10AE0
MNRFVLGALAALFLAGIGMFWWQSRAAVERAAPPQAAPAAAMPEDLPSADPAEMIGPDLPQATEQSREQRRFGRLDRDRDGKISRVEMLAVRAAAFRKLDKDGNNLLTFEEWAVRTVDKFAAADANHDRWLSPQEFRSTAPKPAKAKPRCICAPARHKGAAAKPDADEPESDEGGS